MSDVFETSILSMKSEMYAMTISIEEDFIDNFYSKLSIEDISDSIKEKANIVIEEKDKFYSLLRGLDIQSYIEICNTNIHKLNISLDEKNFINNELSKIMSIVNMNLLFGHLLKQMNWLMMILKKLLILLRLLLRCMIS